ALAKAKPGELNMASSGPGSASHLAGEMFNAMAGTRMTHVPYKGTGAVIPDLMGGRLHFYINPMLAMLSYIQGGRVRLIAVTSPKRLGSMPDVPTVSESGIPGYEATSWYMLIVPGRTPTSIITMLNAEAVKALRAKSNVEALTRAGNDPVANTPIEAMDFL